MNPLLDRLTIKELVVVYQRYHKKRSAREIAKIVDDSPTRIYIHQRNAIRKMTEEITKLLENEKGEVNSKLRYNKHFIHEYFRRELRNEADN